MTFIKGGKHILIQKTNYNKHIYI